MLFVLLMHAIVVTHKKINLNKNGAKNSNSCLVMKILRFLNPIICLIQREVMSYTKDFELLFR